MTSNETCAQCGMGNLTEDDDHCRECGADWQIATRMMREHSNHKRTPFTAWTVTAAGYESVAFFDDNDGEGAQQFARWLYGLGYSAWVSAIEDHDQAWPLIQGRYVAA